MKKFILIVLSSFFLSFILNGCQQLMSEEDLGRIKHNVNLQETNFNKNQTLDVRETVWNQLTENDKEHIQGTWEDASVRKITLKETMGDIKDKTFIGKEVFIMDYPSNDNPTLGGVAVYADIESHRLIGYGYRD